MADVLGISVIHVNRTFRRLSEEKIAEYRKGAIDLLDRARLAEIGSFDPGYLHYEEACGRGDLSGGLGAGSRGLAVQSGFRGG